MRISTMAFNQSAIDSIDARSSELSKIQSQVASGQSIQSPADDPAAMVHILQLQQALTQSTQYGTNADAATTRLSYEDQSLTDTTNLLQHIRDLTVQANSGTQDPTSRAAIATELDQNVQQLLDIANRQDANGQYLFSGLTTQTQPFSRSGTGAVGYSGNDGTRQVQISQTQRVQDGDSGARIFMNVQAGNGTFTTASTTTNTGTGSIGATAVTNPSAWVNDTYTISFTSATAYQVTNSANAVVGSGTFTPNGSITFNGASVTIQGQPAAGDTFTAAPAGTQDMFTTLDNLRTAVRAQINTPADSAQYASNMSIALNQIDQALNHVADVQAGVGARLNTIDTAKATGQTEQVNLQTSLSQLQDLDYASALGKLTLEQTGLQAAEASYSKIAQLSLFNYIK
ncbi:MAG: flagellar hook-associated protein 3 FlgL [Gammaproteobacteria bacterium]|jgi:flagellar hook-associated protein 3 FlgL|nr:flagellar hook-associated protein 3 FlgL [Gammaproteobacteria bacterium]